MQNHGFKNVPMNSIMQALFNCLNNFMVQTFNKVNSQKEGEPTNYPTTFHIRSTLNTLSDIGKNLRFIKLYC